MLVKNTIKQLHIKFFVQIVSLIRIRKGHNLLSIRGGNPLCTGRLTKAWGLGGLLNAHSKESNDLMIRACNKSKK